MREYALVLEAHKSEIEAIQKQKSGLIDQRGYCQDSRHQEAVSGQFSDTSRQIQDQDRATKWTLKNNKYTEMHSRRDCWDLTLDWASFTRGKITTTHERTVLGIADAAFYIARISKSAFTSLAFLNLAKRLSLHYIADKDGRLSRAQDAQSTKDDPELHNERQVMVLCRGRSY